MKRSVKKQILTRGKDEECNITCKTHTCGHGCGSAIYGLGFIGAAVYFISTATGFWNGVWGVIKALVWPAILVFSLLKQLGV